MTTIRMISSAIILLLFVCSIPVYTSFTIQTATSTTRGIPTFSSSLSSILSTTKSTTTKGTTVRSGVSLFSTSLANEKDSSNKVLDGLNVVISGGGPSGLLVAHGLLQAGATVSIYEKRNRPGLLELEQRAYALGVGLRGRTAIQTVDALYNNKPTTTSRSLWDAIKTNGYGSERFILHVGPFSIKLRDENDSIDISESNNDGEQTISSSSSSTSTKLEPSLLLFQSELCRALVDELDSRWSASGRLALHFNTPITTVNLQTNTIEVPDKDGSTTTISKKFDLIVGCDGVNSIVRKAMGQTYSNIFKQQQELLPGYYKVVRLPTMPSTLDPTAVQLLFPNKGAVSCFVEPTANGQCCLLFAGRNNSDILLASPSSDASLSNVTAIEAALRERYPKLVSDADDDDRNIKLAAQQLLQSNPSQASKVQCNTFHCTSKAVLVGDAAHATGGVSGQGVNSAFQDAAVLINSILDNFGSKTGTKEQLLQNALLQYSKYAVPEAKALYDLSFGPSNVSTVQRIRLTIKNIVDFLFKGTLFGIGERPLNTLLTTSSQSFASIRRKRDTFYAEPFPDQTEFDTLLTSLHNQIIESDSTTTTTTSAATNKPSTTEITV